MAVGPWASPEAGTGTQPKPKQSGAVTDALNALVARHPAIGFWQAYLWLRLTGRPWNHKRVYRIYTGLGLNIRRRAKKRLPARVKHRLFQPTRPNQVWSLDYIHDSLRADATSAERANLPYAECRR